MAVKEMLGTLACLNPNCGVAVPVKKSSGGAISVNCAYCDLTVYAKAGTQSHSHILALLKPARSDQPATASVKSEPAPAAKPAKPAASASGLIL